MTTTAPATTAPAATGISLTDNGAASTQGNATTSPATTTAPSTGSTGTQTTTEPAATTDPFAALTGDNRALVDKKGWKSVEDVAKSYKELETAFSAKGAASTPPATPNDYKFTVPADLPKEAGYNDEFAGWFKNTAHAAGVSQEAAAKMHDAFVGLVKDNHGKGMVAQTATLQQTVTKAAADLKTTWGNEGTPEFTRNLTMAKRAMAHLDPGLADALKQVGAVTADGNIANATIFKALSQVGNRLFAEDTVYGQAQAGVNPFDPKTSNMTQQGLMIKADPEKAEMLIRAAGPETVQRYGHFLARRK